MIAAAALPVVRRGVLRHPAFRRLWLAQLISTLGDALTTCSLVLLINQRTGSTAAIATLSVLVALPDLGLGLLAGAIVDRVDRRRLMLASDLLRAVLVLGLLIVSGGDGLWPIYALAPLQAGVGTFFTPARGALVQRVVPEAERLAANALSESAVTLAEVTGTAAAGLLVGLTGAYGLAFGLDAVTFLISFALVLGVHSGPSTPAPSDAATLSVWRTLLEGLATVGRSRTLLGLLLILSVMFLGGAAIQVLLVPLAINVLHIPMTWVGFFSASTVVGMLAGGAALGGLGSRLRPDRLLVVGLFGFAAVITALAVVPNAWLLLPILAAFGTMQVVLQTSLATLSQRAVSNDLMGRVGGTFGTVAAASSLLSVAAAGALSELVGLRTVLVLSAAVVAACGLLAACIIRERGDRGEERGPGGGAGREHSGAGPHA
jgi:MFS family permease